LSDSIKVHHKSPLSFWYMVLSPISPIRCYCFVGAWLVHALDQDDHLPTGQAGKGRPYKRIIEIVQFRYDKDL